MEGPNHDLTEENERPIIFMAFMTASNQWNKAKVVIKSSWNNIVTCLSTRKLIALCSLAYCDLLVTVGTLFRRFPNLKGNKLSAEDLVYDDYFSSRNPLSAKKFHVKAREKT